MGISPARFESAGKVTEHWIPGVYSRRNTIAGSTGVISNNLVILGQSVGGKPRTLLEFGDASEASEGLTGGPLLEAIAHAFNGSSDFVPQKVFGFRVNNGTQSSLTLKNGAENILNVKSADYGVHTNQLKMWVKDGTAAGSKKFTVSFKGNDIETDNIQRKSFSLLYAGAGVNAKASVTVSGITVGAEIDNPATRAWESVRLTNTTDAEVIVPAGTYTQDDGAKTWSFTLPEAVTLPAAGTYEILNLEAQTAGVDPNLPAEGADITATITPALQSGITATAFDVIQGTNAGTQPVDTLTVTWDEAETLDDLVSRFNDTGVYIATLIDATPDRKTSELDTVSDVALTPSAAVFKSDLQAFMEELRKVPFIGSVLLATAAVRVVPENNESYVYFTGGTAGTFTVADWVDALSALEEEDVQSITTHSDDLNVIVLIANHCISMSTTTRRKERQFLLGAPAGMSDDDGAALAASLNSELGSLIIDSAVASNPLTGVTEEIPPALVDCKIAGMEASMGMSSPLTNKVVKVNSWWKKRKTSQIDKLIKGGVMPCDINEEGYLVVIRAMTTYQGDNLALNERSCVREALYMDRDLRKAYAPDIGTAPEPSESAIKMVLLNKAKEWKRYGYITPADDGSNVFDIKIRFDGDKVYLEYGKYLRAPRNFVFITSNNMIYSSAE